MQCSQFLTHAVLPLLVRAGLHLTTIKEGIMRSVLFLVSALLLGLSNNLQATIINVPGDAPTIQRGINAAVDGDTVMVALGTYYEYNLDFLGKAITVMSTHPANPGVVERTIIDAQGDGKVFYFHSGEDSTSVLSGFTITGGSSNYGAGIYCSGSSPKISNNAITGNMAYSSFAYGGGIYYGGSSSPIIKNNVIKNNSASAEKYDDAAVAKGGGIYCVGSGGKIINNIIIENEAEAYSVEYGDYAYGGGIYVGSSTQITNNVISGNSVNASFKYGGGIYCSSSSNANIKNSIIRGNSPDEIWGNPTVTYSDVEGGWAGEGNINADPLFRTYHGFDYLLQRASPCIDAGDPAIEDGFDWPNSYNNAPRSDMGAYGGPGNVNWLP